MLTSLQVCFNAVAPLFLIMALGYGAKCLGAISVDAVPSLNKLAFRYFMPVMLFRNLYDSSLSHAVQPRLLLFAVISHFAYIFASNDFADWHSFIPFYYGNILNQTSVIWSLAWGLVLLRIADNNRIKMPAKVILTLLICAVALPADWSCIASLSVLSIGTNRGEPKKQIAWSMLWAAVYAVVYFFAIDKIYGLIQLCVALAIPLLFLYNGKRGRNPKINRFMKWLFYAYYPLHLLVIGLIREFVR
mgnify:CR=1 FL=1